MKRPMTSIFILALIAGATIFWQAGAADSAPSAQPAPTPYKCYLIGGLPPQVPPVELETQFGVEPRVQVGPPAFLCEPALKNGEGDLGQTPYKAYAIADTHSPDVLVDLETQFGIEEDVLVGQAAFLWEPALVNGMGDPTRTPYKCYQISDTHDPTDVVDLVTQFPPEPPIVEPNVPVGLAQFLCEPALRDGIGDMSASPYKCYGISNTVAPPIQPVTLWTYFGRLQEPPIEEVVQVGPAQLLCDPAVKYLANPVGGLAELPAVAEGDGWSAGMYAALAGGLAAAVLALTAGAWYARRRWVR